MIREENTVEEFRELIAVSPKIERALQAFARANPRDAHWIEASLKFRHAPETAENAAATSGTLEQKLARYEISHRASAIIDAGVQAVHPKIPLPSVIVT